MDKLSQLVGASIKGFRDERGLSQDQLAVKSGVSRTFIANLELGKKNVTINTLVKITDALEVSLSDFFKVLQLDSTEDWKDTSLLNSMVRKILSMDCKQQKDISKIISIFSKYNKTKD